MISALVQSNDVPRLDSRMDAWLKLTRGGMLKDVAELAAEQARTRVKNSKHSPDLKPWPPRKSGGEHPLLVKTGRLLRSIRKQRRGASEYNSGVQGSIAARVSAYAVYQQYGTRRGIEPRAFIGVGFNDAQEIRDLLEAFVEVRFQ